VSVRKIKIKMPATKVNLSQMVDLAVVTPRIGAVNSNVLHTLLHAMLRQLNIVDVQAESDLNGNDMDFLSASKARELSVLSDIDSGGDDGAEDALRLNLSERSSSMPTPSTGKSNAEMWLNILLFLVQTNEKGMDKVWLILDSFPHIYRLIRLSFICCNLCN
jgi:hypothetical protein